MPFGEVMYRCNAHFCFNSIFRNRVAGLVITLALMQLFLFSFYLNGLHSETVNMATAANEFSSAFSSSEQLVVIPTPPPPPSLPDSVITQAVDIVGFNGDPDRRISTTPHLPVGQEAEWNNLSSKTRVVARKALDHLIDNNKPAIDMVAIAARKLSASAAAAVAANPAASSVGLDPLAKISLNMLANAFSGANSFPSSTDNAAAALVKTQYTNLAQMGLHLLSNNFDARSTGSSNTTNKSEASRMLDMATQLVLQNARVDPQMTKSVVTLLKSAMGNQKMDTKLVGLGLVAKMIQQQQQQQLPGQRTGSDLGVNLLRQILMNGQLASALLKNSAAGRPSFTSSSPDQSFSVARNYIKLANKMLPAIKSKLKLPETTVGRGKIVVDLDFKFPVDKVAFDVCRSTAISPVDSPTTNLVVVVSSAAHLEDRQAARDSWVRDFRQLSGGKVKVVFFVGQTKNSTLQRLVHEEATTYSDLVQTNVPETTENAVYKTLASLVWIHQSCPAPIKQILRVDDDVFVSAAKMLKIMETSQTGPFMTGNIVSHVNPHEESAGTMELN